MGNREDRLTFEFMGLEWRINMGVPDWIVGNIPQRMRGAALRYIMDGVIPGHFMTAVFENNLYEAVCCADEENRQCLHAYAMMLNAIPAGCWGSRDRVNEWVRVGGLNGLRKEQGVEDEHSDHHEA
jgi:hypothetical protein